MLRYRTAAALALALGLVGCKSEEAKETQRVRILATTDEHSHVLAAAPEKDDWPLAAQGVTGSPSLKGGIARRATVIHKERDEGVPTVLLSNGDYSQGTLAAVAYTVKNFDAMLMRKLGYDAIALGNHEFDLQPAGLVEAIENTAGGAPQFVLTNAIFSSTDAADDSLEAIYGGVGSGKKVVSGLIVDKAGVKVGVVSAMGPSAAYDGQYTAAPVTFSTASLTQSYASYVPAAAVSIAAILQPVIDQLRTQGAKVVVLLFHGGLPTTGSNADVQFVLPLIGGIDLVVAGHTHGIPAGTQYLADKDSKQVPVMQPAPFGDQVIRAEFVIEDGKARFDTSKEAFLEVNDTLAPTPDLDIQYAISTVLSSIESSLLPGTLKVVTGIDIADNAFDVGDLYFYPLGHTAFDVTGASLPRETKALNLDTDAMLAITKGLGYTTEVALQNAGSIRGDLVQGGTGTIAFADVFRMASLGGDPYDTPPGPGYPLIHAYIRAMELRAAFEQTLQMAYLNNDYYLGEAGLKMEWDPTRTACAGATSCALGPGWLKSFQLMDGATNPVLYDPGNAAYDTQAGWAGTPVVLPGPVTVGSEALRRIPVVTTLLVASFAGKMGVSLFADEVSTTPVTDLSTLVVEVTGPGTPSPSVPNVKDHQALARYIFESSFANGGELPATYNTVDPNRVFCTGVACP